MGLILVVISIFVYRNRSFFFGRQPYFGVKFVFPETFIPGEDATFNFQIAVRKNNAFYMDLQESKISFFCNG